MRRRTRMFLWWVAAPAAGLALMFLLRMGVLAICFYAIYFLLLMARLMSRFWLRPMQVERELSRDVVERGETVRVFVRMRNRAWYPILWNFVEETVPSRALVEGVTRRLAFLMPGQTLTLFYSFTPSQRGCYRLGPLVSESGDVFGLFKRCRVDSRLDFVTVLPNYRVIEEFQVGQHRRLADLAAARSIFEDPTRLRGIREYRRGDALKRIHWRATAHAGALCSKIYDPVLEAGATVALDFHRDSWRQAVTRSDEQAAPETAIEIACSICRYLADGRWKVGFFSNGRDPLGLPGMTTAQARLTESLGQAEAAAGARPYDERLAPIAIRASARSEQFSVIRENLGRIELSDGLRMENLLPGELPYIDRQQVIVLLTGDMTDGLIDCVGRVRALGYRVMVFVVRNPQAHDRAFEAFVPLGISVFDMAEEWRLDEIATGRQQY